MKIEFDNDHKLELFIDWCNKDPKLVRLTGFGVHPEAKTWACAEFSNPDRSKVMYVGLSGQKVLIFRKDDLDDPHFIMFRDFLGTPIQTGEENHGDKYYHRTRNQAIEEWWNQVVLLATSSSVAASYIGRPFTTYPTEHDKEAMIYDYEHGDIDGYVQRVLDVVERLV